MLVSFSEKSGADRRRADVWRVYTVCDVIHFPGRSSLVGRTVLEDSLEDIFCWSIVRAGGKECLRSCLAHRCHGVSWQYRHYLSCEIERRLLGMPRRHRRVEMPRNYTYAAPTHPFKGCANQRCIDYKTCYSARQRLFSVVFT